MITAKRTVSSTKHITISKKIKLLSSFLKSIIQSLGLTLILLHVQNAIASSSKIKINILINKLTFYSILHHTPFI